MDSLDPLALASVRYPLPVPLAHGTEHHQTLEISLQSLSLHARDEIYPTHHR